MKGQKSKTERRQEESDSYMSINQKGDKKKVAKDKEYQFCTVLPWKFNYMVEAGPVGRHPTHS